MACLREQNNINGTKPKLLKKSYLHHQPANNPYTGLDSHLLMIYKLQSDLHMFATQNIDSIWNMSDAPCTYMFFGLDHNLFVLFTCHVILQKTCIVDVVCEDLSYMKPALSCTAENHILRIITKRSSQT